jgi:REP element-mobilizing transposase RayT
MRTKSQSFLPGLSFKTISISHGGEFGKGKRKRARPVDPKQALHVVLRSSLAKGEKSMLHPKHCKGVHGLTIKLAKRWGIRIYRYANVGNHIHLLIKVPTKAAWQRFSRELSGGIAMIVTGAKKGAPLMKNGQNRGFWDHLVFTRIVRFGRDFESVGRYLIKNLFEAAGVSMKKLGLYVLMINKDGTLTGAPPGRLHATAE